MKKSITISIIILFVISGCGGNKQSSNELITVDILKTDYPKKELILQDFMDVEYIALETNDDFVNQGFVQAVGKDIILVTNYKDDGDIFVYDRTGKAIRKINRKGQGGEEYINCRDITLDDDTKEMYVNDAHGKKIQVYDLEGNYIRTLKVKSSGRTLFYTYIFDYDRDHLICFDELNEEVPFLLVSKQDGNITQEIIPPFEERKLLHLIYKDYANDQILASGIKDYRPILPSYDGNWILTEASSDTIYTLMPDYSLRPFIARTPFIQSMEPEVYLILRLVSNRYYFMETVKMEYDFEKQKGFPKTYFVYDTQEKDFFRYTIYNGDFSSKKEIYMVSLTPVNHEIESWQSLSAPELCKDYEKGKLKGQLKEIAAELDEDANPVIMLVKHKQ